MRYLLDKVTVRYILQATHKLNQSFLPTPDELIAFRFFADSESSNIQLYIAAPTVNVLQILSMNPEYTTTINTVKRRLHGLYPGRYYTRWARRLRNLSFTREDAAMLALATFGIEPGNQSPGMDALITFDRPMINHWRTNQLIITAKLTAMQYDLSPLYQQIQLPKVVRPDAPFWATAIP